MDKILEYLKGSIGFYIALYLVLALGEQISNGIFNTKFVIKDLTEIFLYVFGQVSVKYSIDSVFNSCKGEKPN